MDNVNVTIDLIMGDKMMNHFMHAADMFEDFKQLGKYSQIVLPVGSDGPAIQKLTTAITKHITDSKMNPIFVSIRQVGPLLTNDFERYIKPGISVISDGHKWGMFHQILKDLGYKVETDEHMRVLSVKLLW